MRSSRENRRWREIITFATLPGNKESKGCWECVHQSHSSCCFEDSNEIALFISICSATQPTACNRVNFELTWMAPVRFQDTLQLLMHTILSDWASPNSCLINFMNISIIVPIRWVERKRSIII